MLRTDTTTCQGSLTSKHHGLKWGLDTGSYSLSRLEVPYLPAPLRTVSDQISIYQPPTEFTDMAGVKTNSVGAAVWNGSSHAILLR